MTGLLTQPAQRPLPAPVFVRPYVLDELHRRRRWKTRRAKHEATARALEVLFTIARTQLTAAA